MGKPLERFMLATIETIMEGIRKEPWTAFVNNAFDFSAVMLNNKEFIEQIRGAKDNPLLLDELKAKAVQKWGKDFSDSKVAKIFNLVWANVLYTASTIIEIAEIAKEEE